ncbi:MAG: type III pantothenate kinase, partial [Candidatus Latescibacterota bacterium]
MTMNKGVTICVDVGNTSVKVDLAGPEGIEMLGAEPTRRPQSSARIKKLLRSTRPTLPDQFDVILCTVVPEMGKVMREVLAETLGVKPFSIRHTCRFPFELGVEHPAKVGPDRLCAAAGAFAGHAGQRTENAIVVDIGSAVTVDLVHRRRFCGGLILVGPALG